jgi:hypothetical protein
MRKVYLSLGLVSFIISIAFSSCEREEVLPPNHAKGKIILVTGGCYGEIVLIEVNNPKGIGLSGRFSELGMESQAIIYNNAIGVPYFSKIGLPDSIPQNIGTELYFEFRELTTEEWENGHLYESTQPIFCTMNIIPLNAKLLIITKVISYTKE